MSVKLEQSQLADGTVEVLLMHVLVQVVVVVLPIFELEEPHLQIVKSLPVVVVVQDIAGIIVRVTMVVPVETLQVVLVFPVE
jgi:hypothetical protein